MKRDKGKKGGGRETKKRVGFLPSPIGFAATLFHGVTKTLLYSFKSKRWFNKRKSNVLWLNHLWDIEEQKCFWNTLKKRTPRSEWGRGGNLLFFCVSLPPPFFPLSLFIFYYNFEYFLLILMQINIFFLLIDSLLPLLILSHSRPFRFFIFFTNFESKETTPSFGFLPSPLPLSWAV